MITKALVERSTAAETDSRAFSINHSELVSRVAAPAVKSSASRTGTTELVLPNLPCRLQYPLLGYTGALSAPWLERRVAKALENADRLVRGESKGLARILIWDALRTRECQKDIWNRYAAQLRAEHPSMREEQVQVRVAKFVSNPNGVFRHGTGGAVDVTLLVDGNEANMGTAFDEFSPRAAADYFRNWAHETERDREAHKWRELLRGAMESVGFVVLREEWWHFELGTEMRGEIMDVVPFLTRVVEPPAAALYPAQALSIPKSMPALTTSVAQAFQTKCQRQSALAGDISGHYYARTSTPSRTELEAMFAGT